MSWSLQLSNGDFSLSGSQLALVTDSAKLLQDLRCWVLERMGTDDMHLSYGSLIDGGTMPDGTVVPSLIGQSDFQTAATTIQSEIQRIAGAYQTQQLNRAKADQQTYSRVTLSPAEILLSISGITTTQQTTTIAASAQLTNAQGETIAAALPLLTGS